MNGTPQGGCLIFTRFPRAAPLSVPYFRNQDICIRFGALKSLSFFDADS